MTTTAEDLYLEPAVDPATKKMAVRHVTGVAKKTVTKIKIRQYDPFTTDEPESLGGTGTAPTPIEMLLGALIGCEAVIIKGVAEQMRFEYGEVNLSTTSQLDIRGPKGVVGVRPIFETVELIIDVQTNEPEDRFRKMVHNVENRCPVMNLMKDAGVDMQVTWRAIPF